MTIAQDFEYFEERFGKPTSFAAASEDVLQRLAKHVPSVMIEYWQKFGFSTFLDGYFQLVNPEDYAVPLTEWIKGTEFEGKDTYHVFSRTCFGDLRVWGETTGRDFHLDILLDALIIRKKNDAAGIAAGKANVLGEDAFFDLDPKPGDLRDRLLRVAQQSLGSLGADQIYGFSPALQLGGEIDAANLKIVPAASHLTVLAGLSEKPVTGMDGLAKRAFGSGADESLDEAFKKL
jgi:hypothetical protein